MNAVPPSRRPRGSRGSGGKNKKAKEGEVGESVKDSPSKSPRQGAKKKGGAKKDPGGSGVGTDKPAKGQDQVQRKQPRQAQPRQPQQERQPQQPHQPGGGGGHVHPKPPSKTFPGHYLPQMVERGLENGTLLKVRSYCATEGLIVSHLCSIILIRRASSASTTATTARRTLPLRTPATRTSLCRTSSGATGR